LVIAPIPLNLPQNAEGAPDGAPSRELFLFSHSLSLGYQIAKGECNMLRNFLFALITVTYKTIAL
jgi:hypothetical protein